jgi:NADH:ubiquinone oxidoreductase subunit E
MKKKIKISICTGTACFVMGASEIMLLEEKLPETIRQSVDLEIEGLTCMGNCKDRKTGKPPFVKINDEIITEANLVTILDKIYELAGETNAAHS